MSRNNLHLIKRQKKNDKNKKASADAISLLFDKAPNEKNLTKKNFKNIINILLNKISDLKTKQDNLENISNLVAEQNKELLCHNEILIKELKNKM